MKWPKNMSVAVRPGVQVLVLLLMTSGKGPKSLVSVLSSSPREPYHRLLGR